MDRESLQVVDVREHRRGESRAVDVDGLVALGRAISDPIRVRMLGMLGTAASEGRGCCGLPASDVPAQDKGTGICACEFEESFGMAQSKVSYHLSKLKEAGLVREEKRGKWSFYSLNRDAFNELLAETARHVGTSSDKDIRF